MTSVKISMLSLFIFSLLIAPVIKVSVREVIWALDYTIEGRVAIKDTFWVAEVRSNRCLFSCNAYQGVDIRLVNPSTGETRTLVVGADVLKDQLSSSAPGELTITLSNLTVAKINNVPLPSIHVFWNFLPKDDPQARSANISWLSGDKTLESNRILYCKYVFPGIPNSNPNAFDENIALHVYGSNSKKVHYCLEN